MARTNVAVAGPRTYEGGPAVAFSPQDQLRRAVMTCLLWENNFYIDGTTVAGRIKELVAVVPVEYTAALAIEARNAYKMRHVSLLLVRELLRRAKECLAAGVDLADVISQVVQRADEPGELLALYWAEGRRPLPASLKRGLADAVTKFDAYQIGKWKGDDKAVKFRDVLFMTHAKPKDEQQAADWRALIDGTLASPDTWEVALSAGKDKRETFERLLQARKLGYMALLRNLRNMQEAGVDRGLVHVELVRGAANSRALPFRFLAAARHAPQWEPMIDEAMQLAVAQLPKLPGLTRLLVDVSASMNDKLSAKSDLTRLDAACALAILLRGICEHVDVYTFSNHVVTVPARQGMALRDAIYQSQPRSGTYLGMALKQVAAERQTVPVTRTIVITDEQAADIVGGPVGKGYMLDVAGHQNGVGFGAWTRVSGFSEAVVNYIAAIEGLAMSEHADD